LTSQRVAPHAWWALAVLVLGRVALGFQFQSLVSAAPMLIDEFHIDYATVGTLAALYTLPGLVCALPFGLLGKSHGNRNVIAIGLLMMTVGGLIAAFAWNVSIIGDGRFVSGVGAIGLFVLLAKMTTDWFSGRALGIAMSFVVNGWSLGIGIGVLSQHAIGHLFSWRAIFLATSGLSFVALLLMVFAYGDPGGPRQTGSAVVPARISLRDLLNMSGAALGLTFYNAAAVMVISLTPSLLTSQGISELGASFIVNLHVIVSAVGVALGGYAASSRYKYTVLLVTSFGSAAILAATATGEISGTIFVLAGLLTGAPAAALMILPATVVAPENRDVGFGILYTWVYGGMAVLMMAAGYLRGVTQSPAAPIVFSALLLALVPLTTLAALAIVRGAPFTRQSLPRETEQRLVPANPQADR
jgi:predicted MFS family arabinose efflux permease